MNRITVLSIFGTRPEAIKMAPLVLELKKHEDINALVCVTAQHRQMLDQVLSIFGITPDYDLNIMKPRQTLADITTNALNGIDGVLKDCKPDLVLVHGDTTTTFSGSLAAFYNQVTVGHVEAGLRTYDKYSPFPEEINRRLTGQIAGLHFAPTGNNRGNLARENITDGVYVTGNTVIDALKTTVKDKYTFEEPALNAVDLSRPTILLTAHRRENLGQPLYDILNGVKRILEDLPEVQVIYPVHLNPVVQNTAREVLGDCKQAHLIPPLGVSDMHNLMARCHLVMTDSGGLQEEAPALGKPVLVLRTETERPEAVKAGTVKVIGVKTEDVYREGKKLLCDKEAYEAMAKAVNPYGDGQASARIAAAIRFCYHLTEQKPEEFMV